MAQWIWQLQADTLVQVPQLPVFPFSPISPGRLISKQNFNMVELLLKDTLNKGYHRNYPLQGTPSKALKVTFL